MQRILLLDNYDSFTHNLYHLIEKVWEGSIEVIRNDQITVEEVNDYDAIVLSPGPKLPKEAGIMMEVIHRYHACKPIVGICLGMQGIAQYFGSTLDRLPIPEHGQSKKMHVVKYSEIFKNCPSVFHVGRYHSWGVKLDKLSPDLMVLGVDEHNWVMAFQHTQYRILGIQYHPESILTEYREEMMRNIVDFLSVS